MVTEEEGKHSGTQATGTRTASKSWKRQWILPQRVEKEARRGHLNLSSAKFLASRP